MGITARQLTLATLDRQLLLRREPLDVAEAVRRICAAQAQAAASPYLALWNRVSGFAPDDLDAAFAQGRVVKASLMRITLHAVHGADYADCHAAMRASLRGARVYDRRFTSAGLTAADADGLLAELPGLLAGPRTGAQMEEELGRRFGAGAQRLWWALRTYAPLHHVPTGGPWAFRLPNTYRAAPAAPSADPGPDLGPEDGADTAEDAAVQRLLLAYLRAFGPATARDFARFTLLTSPVVRRALDRLGERVVPVAGPDSGALLDLADATVPEPDTPAPPRLLPMWDSVLMAYAGHGRIVPEEYRPLIVRRNGDTLPTLLVDGQVAGVWRAVDGGVELTAFRPLRAARWRALTEEAERLSALLADREPAVYSRYRHWWDKGFPADRTTVVTP
ncbi:winged helix DNA-binding domain-containing protein [Actinacidiphila sp. bgisy145]|uniref:winged helix DNA-binding domain-containing protein n=1 Tax=Actinacidiphila sp. bgisy145 TaxID=3413792 RepID=UPI003EBEF38F